MKLESLSLGEVPLIKLFRGWDKELDDLEEEVNSWTKENASRVDIKTITHAFAGHGDKYVIVMVVYTEN